MSGWTTETTFESHHHQPFMEDCWKCGLRPAEFLCLKVEYLFNYKISWTQSRTMEKSLTIHAGFGPQKSFCLTSEYMFNYFIIWCLSGDRTINQAPGVFAKSPSKTKKGTGQDEDKSVSTRKLHDFRKTKAQGGLSVCPQSPIAEFDSWDCGRWP